MLTVAAVQGVASGIETADWPRNLAGSDIHTEVAESAAGSQDAIVVADTTEGLCTGSHCASSVADLVELVVARCHPIESSVVKGSRAGKGPDLDPLRCFNRGSESNKTACSYKPFRSRRADCMPLSEPQTPER